MEGQPRRLVHAATYGCLICDSPLHLQRICSGGSSSSCRAQVPTAAYGGFSLASLAFAEAKLDGAISLYIVCKLDNFMDGEFAIRRPRPLSLPARGERAGVRGISARNPCRGRSDKL